ncbi:phage SPO1 DNA polymerase-related protein [Ignisphaera aggregans DSM 17230]|uniref:Type-4 uracil-DNA glycosylase n=1 Tax=Ignisphaera aggregans (strain DSM 17230 / JCM 13409 / AQ1.S1) TaxID=583356 RepID=E0SQC9_IGNAA|nr:phage SPO1 DNA polymerase-related protein [Ignisphaera aggregans DSM 17230]
MSLDYSWQELENAIRNCTRCQLYRNRKNAVPGEGPKDAFVMFIGEAPGATEDEMGRPFVGAAGKLLTMIMENLGISRDSVYITNVVKCRPPNNREPSDEEIEKCGIYLETQIRLIKPKIIVTLGNIAGKTIFFMGKERWEGIMKMRGRVYNMKIFDLTVYVIPTIHPAAGLYNPNLKNLLIQDLKIVKECIDKMSTNPQDMTAKPKTLLSYMKK